MFGMGYEMQPSFLRRRVLVAVAPDDVQGIALVKAMRALGLTVIIAATVGLASQADEVAVCVVVLHPEKWRLTPSITTAMRRNPAYMVPVVAEPMVLPRAAWATEPFCLHDFPIETARALVTLIRRHLQSIAERELATVAARPMLQPWLREPEPFVPIVVHKQAQRQRIGHYALMCWPLGFVLCISFLTYYFFQLSALTNTEAITHSIVTTTWRDHAYTALVPGDRCDTGGAEWMLPSYYKGIVSPSSVLSRAGVLSATAKRTPTPSNFVIPPTPPLILDTSTVITCQQNGVLLTHTKHYDTFARMIFASRGLPLPQQFSTQITATAITASDQAVLRLGVRDQSSSDSSGTEQGYGDDVLQIGVNGKWVLQRYGNSSNAVEAIFSHGIVKPAQSYTLKAVSKGSVITFSINGQDIATLTDTTYPASYGIDFGISDPGAKHPPSALFSHFSYTPLP